MLAEAQAVFLFINSSSQHYSTCSCPIIINHSRTWAGFSCSPERRYTLRAVPLHLPTAQAERSEWDSGWRRRGEGWFSCSDGGSYDSFQTPCVLSFRSLRAPTSSIWLLQHTHTQHAHQQNFLLCLIVWCARKMWVRCNCLLVLHLSLSISFHQFLGKQGSLLWEPCKGGDPDEIL